MAKTKKSHRPERAGSVVLCNVSSSATASTLATMSTAAPWKRLMQHRSRGGHTQSACVRNDLTQPHKIPWLVCVGAHEVRSGRRSSGETIIGAHQPRRDSIWSRLHRGQW